MMMMHTKNLEFPPLVTSRTEVPPDGLPPYSSDDETGDLNFFKEEATYEQWGRYHVWLQEQREWRRDPDETTAILHGELITSSDVFTLKKSEWVMDNLLHYVYKSQIGVTDPLVAFFPSFFFTKLYQEGNADSEKADTYSYAGVASWTKKILRGTPIDEMKTIVFLLNQGRMHWKCFAIFMDLKIIQVFDSGGSGGGQTLQDLYRWLHSTMEIEGKTLKPTEWRLYCCRHDTPRQRDHDCGVYAIMFAMCVSKRLPLSLITRRRIEASKVILLCHLIGLQPERAGPLGAMNEFIPKRFRNPDTPSKELDSEAVLDLTSTPPKMDSRGNQSNNSVLDLISPDKNPRKGTDEAVIDQVTPPTNLFLKLS
jgi:hypothetical protein